MGFFKTYGQELRELQEAAVSVGRKLNFFASYWSVKEVAAFLGLSEPTVNQRKAGTRSIPCYRFGEVGKRQTVRFKAMDVIAFRERVEGKAKVSIKE